MKQPDTRYSLTLSVGGKQRKVSVLSPADAFCRLESWLSELRPRLIWEAERVVHDRSLAEDLVQNGQVNAYRYLNNGALHVVKLPEGTHMLVKGGDAPGVHRQWEEKVVNRWLQWRERKEGQAPSLDVIEEAEQWLCAIVRNEAYNYYNKRKKFLLFWQRYTGILSVEDFQFESAEHTVLQDEHEEEVRAFVAALPPEFRDIIWLRYWGEWSFAAIAERLHQPGNTVRSQEFRARGMLKDALTGQRTIEHGRLTRPKRFASASPAGASPHLVSPRGA